MALAQSLLWIVLIGEQWWRKEGVEFWLFKREGRPKGFHCLRSRLIWRGVCFDSLNSVICVSWINKLHSFPSACLLTMVGLKKWLFFYRRCLCTCNCLQNGKFQPKDKWSTNCVACEVYICVTNLFIAHIRFVTVLHICAKFEATFLNLSVLLVERLARSSSLDYTGPFHFHCIFQDMYITLRTHWMETICGKRKLETDKGQSKRFFFQSSSKHNLVYHHKLNEGVSHELTWVWNALYDSKCIISQNHCYIRHHGSHSGVHTLC